MNRMTDTKSIGFSPFQIAKCHTSFVIGNKFAELTRTSVTVEKYPSPSAAPNKRILMFVFRAIPFSQIF
jgi:hypothetical protein